MTSLPSIKQFAESRNLRVSVDKGDGSSIINGRYGHLYEYSDRELALIFMGDSVGKANSRRKACVAAGMEVTQDGDTEFAVAFNPDSKTQVRLAIKVAGVKTKRVLSPAQIANLETLKAAGKHHRFVGNTGKNEPLAA